MTPPRPDPAYDHAVRVLEDPNHVAGQIIGRDYLSYSSISTYQRCPLRFYFQYVAGLEPEFKPSSLVFGGAIHAAIEQHFLRLFEGVPAPGLDQLMRAYDIEWRYAAAGEVQYGKGESAETLRDLAERMLVAFQQSAVAQPGGELLAVEEEFRAPVVDGCPDLLGRVDLVVLHPDHIRIVDFKTSRSSWSHAKVQEAAPQQLLYAELIQPIAACYPDRPVRLEWAVLTKGKTPAVEQHGLAPEPSQAARTKAVVRRVWQAIAQEHFYPSPSAMNCATCPYQAACRKWEG